MRLQASTVAFQVT